MREIVRGHVEHTAHELRAHIGLIRGERIAQRNGHGAHVIVRPVEPLRLAAVAERSDQHFCMATGDQVIRHAVNETIERIGL